MHFALIFDGDVGRYPPHNHRRNVRHHILCSREMQELSRVKIRDVKSSLNYGGFEVFHFTGMNYRSSPFCRFFVLLALDTWAIQSLLTELFTRPHSGLC